MEKLKKLDSKNIRDIFALTPMQEGMLFQYLKDPGIEVYFEQLSLVISGEIDRAIFEKAWNSVIEANEMLRVVFRWEKVENPVQIILKENTLQPRYHDFSGKAAHDVQNLLVEIKVKDRKEKFDLQSVPFRVTLCKIEEKKYLLMISNHHILYDGWSSGILLKEFFQSYDDSVKGKPLIRPIKTEFKEFLKWVNSQNNHEQGKFWRGYLTGFERPTGLSVIKRRKKQIICTENYQIKFTQALTGKLEDFAREHKITLASLFYCSWGILLQKYNSTEDVIFGTTVSGRPTKLRGVENVVG
ncbi:MAG: condensation domain-containing protein, partial [Candidatus Aminicenantes bacterium]